VAGTTWSFYWIGRRPQGSVSWKKSFDWGSLAKDFP
jgi:hypothetical protein